MMENAKLFTLPQVAQHKFKTDCWIVINGRVLDVTKFLEEHPGGDEILLECAGKDATKEFEDVGHSAAAKNMLSKYQIGYLQGANIISQFSSAADSFKEIQNSEMKAFVIKEDPKFKRAAFLEFFVPLFVAISYLTYRFVTGAVQFSS